MSKPKRQHYVPQFYLRNFGPNENQIYVFDKIERKTFSSAIASVASDKFFYEWDVLNAIIGEQFLEKKFSAFEGLISATLKNLVSSLDNDSFDGISDRVRFDLSEFVWYQMIRNPEGRIIGQQMNDELIRVLKESGSSEGLFEKYGLSESYDQKVEHLKILLSGNVADRVKNIARKIWIIVKNETSIDFYTSDNPVVHYTHREVHHLAHEMFYPLNSKYGILILYRDLFQEYEKFENKILYLKNDEFITFYNTLQVSQSTRQIFSKTGNFSHAEQLVISNPMLSDINRPRFN